MLPVSIIIALAVMLAAIFIPGLILTFVILKDITSQERVMFSFIFGMLPIYLSYLLVKNNFMQFTSETVIICILASCSMVVLKKDAREWIIGFLFTKGHQ